MLGYTFPALVSLSFHVSRKLIDGLAFKDRKK